MSHVQHECDSSLQLKEPIEDEKREVEAPREWAIQQVEHTLDYAVDSTFWLHVSNGLNLQVVHHLFPQVAWSHYTELAPIVDEVCNEFNVKHATKASFWEALSSHYSYLVNINEGPNASVWVRPPQGEASPGTLATLGQLDAIMEQQKDK